MKNHVDSIQTMINSYFEYWIGVEEDATTMVSKYYFQEETWVDGELALLELRDYQLNVEVEVVMMVLILEYD